ncbi:hypothetical protein AAFC00_004098 [Neodothiora populina]|uniref:Uncharacterized protein n=1 Tax=Neodothiora populina TaxID=2781224 RepID=A0ABR3PIS1_9PEZI
MRPRSNHKLLVLLLHAHTILAAPTNAADTRFGIKFVNEHSVGIHVSNDWAAKDKAEYPDLIRTNEFIVPGGSLYLPASEHTSPKFYLAPTANGKSTFVESRRDHNTVVEATFGGFSNVTYYDVDIEKGISVPIWCHGELDDWDTGAGCLQDVLSVCPKEDRHIDAKTGIYDYCRGTNSAENIAIRASLCPDAYLLWDDMDTKHIHSGHVLTCTIHDPKKFASSQSGDKDE